MKSNKLFQKTRLSLAFWYCLSMELILAIGGFSTYKLVEHIQTQANEQKLLALSGTIHDAIEPLLEESGSLPLVQTRLLFPGLCLGETGCELEDHSIATKRHTVGIFQREGYYVKFIDRAGNPIARINEPPHEHDTNTTQSLVQVTTSKGNYLQASVQLGTSKGTIWGYVQVGKSLNDQEQFLQQFQWSILLGISGSFFFVSAIGWILAGRSIQPIQESYDQMEKFTADAAHELQTPLTIVQSAVEDSYDVTTLEDLRPNLELIQRQTKRLSHLVKDLLLVSRLEQKQITTHWTDICLNDVMRDLVEEFTPIAQRKKLELIDEIPIGTQWIIRGDNQQIYQLVSNLISNAIRYTPEGGTIQIKLARGVHASNLVKISVQDTGIGIAKSDQAKIFDRFYRVNSDRARSSGGTGLGLAIVKAIVKNHRGRISVISKACEGSLFVITLPALRTYL